jgi:hypothetical protein
MAGTEPAWPRHRSTWTVGSAAFDAREVGVVEPMPAPAAALVVYVPDAATTPSVSFGGFSTLAAAQAAVAELLAGLGPRWRSGRFVIVDARTGALLAVRAFG